MAKPKQKPSKTTPKVKAQDATGQPICGAKTRSGALCRNNPMHNGRCRMHGGTNPGAAKGNQNARKHGLYSDYYTPEEAEQLDQVELGRVDDELKLCRIKLRRWLHFEQRIQQAIGLDPEAGLSLDEHKTRSMMIKQPGGDPFDPGDELPGEEITRTRKRINVDDNIDRLLRRIESLERTRKVLIGEDGDSDFEDELETLLNGQSPT